MEFPLKLGRLVPNSWLLTRYKVFRPVALPNSTVLSGPVRDVYSMSRVSKSGMDSKAAGNSPTKEGVPAKLSVKEAIDVLGIVELPVICRDWRATRSLSVVGSLSGTFGDCICLSHG